MQNKNTPKQYRAKKSLGQNFLKSLPALNKIIEAGEVSINDTILEIGPGKGVLTAKLLEKAGKVIAVEKDRELLELLKVKFAEEINSERLMLVQGDILKFQITNYELRSYKVIANIPYNITGAILKKFLAGEAQPERMVLMVQNEVAQRIVARDGKESILSISVKAYGEPRLVMKVPARYFSPAPKVDSAIISIKNISRGMFLTPPFALPILRGGLGRGEARFWEVVKAGFAHKRKKLSGNLKGVISKEKLASLSLENARAEDLSLKDWINLSQN